MSIITDAKWLWKNEQKGVLWGIVAGALIVWGFYYYDIKHNYTKKDV